MFKQVKAHALILIVALFGIVSCESEAPKAGQGGGKYGMMDTNTPDYAAVQFFEHVYTEKTLDNAIKMSTPKMEKLLRSYHIPRNVQRHVFDLVYDEVDIQPDTGNSVGRNEYAKTAVVTLFFTGELHGDRHEDIRIVEMVRIDKKWLVDEIRADKYL